MFIIFFKKCSCSKNQEIGKRKKKKTRNLSNYFILESSNAWSGFGLALKWWSLQWEEVWAKASRKGNFWLNSFRKRRCNPGRWRRVQQIKMLKPPVIWPLTDAHALPAWVWGSKRGEGIIVESNIWCTLSKCFLKEMSVKIASVLQKHLIVTLVKEMPNSAFPPWRRHRFGDTLHGSPWLLLNHIEYSQIPGRLGSCVLCANPVAHRTFKNCPWASGLPHWCNHLPSHSPS
jgi:hypothetical protein